jgi:hypothetical protein
MAQASESRPLRGGIPSPARMAAVLAGDFFAVVDTRGGFGCVAEVWQVFASQFAQVIGVAGNHDDVCQVSRGQGALLDGDWVTMGNLCIGGTGLIMGHSSKPGRRADADQLDRIESVAEARPDVLILHEGPPGGAGQPGQPLIEEIVRRHRVPLTICGHKHWSNPICRNEHGVILNAHERVIVLVR